MSTSAPWRVVAAREISTRLRDKTFLGATAFTMLFLVGFFVVGSIVGGGADEYDVGTSDPAATSIAESAETLLAGSGATDAELTVHEDADRSQLHDELRAGDLDVVLLETPGGFELVGDDGVDSRLAGALSQAARSAAVERNAAAQGVDLGSLQEGAAVQQRLLDPDADEKDARAGVALAFALVFFMTALGFGMMIAQSVVQEKESRIVEILAAAVPLRSLLWGKILGNTVLALGQVVLLATVGIAGLLVTGRRDLLAGVGPAVLWYVAFFVLGFVTLAALWSVAGSLASRQQDLQATTFPGQLLLIVPYFVSVLAGEGVQTVVSMLPIVSTMVMPGRMAEGDVPGWQIAVAVAATVAAAVLFVRVGSRVYERTLLRTGTRIGYRQALRLRAD